MGHMTQPKTLGLDLGLPESQYSVHTSVGKYFSQVTS